MMSDRLAPICIFVYDRFDNLDLVFEALKCNPEFSDTKVYLYSDGYKGDKDRKKVESVRLYLKSLELGGNLSIVERESNYGLEKNITEGISEVLYKHDRVIVLEDDIVVSRYFLRYMNEALDYYKDYEEVMHVSAYIDPIDTSDLNEDTFFIPTTSCWGWGTWKESWIHYQSDAKEILNSIEQKSSLSEFDFSKADVFRSQLLDNASGKKSTWAIKWMGCVFLKNGLCLHPKVSLTKNVGFGETATNTKKISGLYKNQALLNFNPKIYNIQHEVNNEVIRKLRWLYCYNGEVSTLKRYFVFFGKKIKRLLRDVKRRKS